MIKEKIKIHKIKVLIGIVFAVLLCVAGYFFYKYQMLKKQFADSNLLSQQEIQSLTNTIGKHLLLPKEVPTVFTVKDVTKLQNQDFFKHAENGDKVLVYNNAREAILYDPKKDIIISVGPVNFDTPTPSAPQQKIILRNGTTLATASATVQQLIQKDFPSASLVAEQGKKKTYTKTVIIPLTVGAKSTAATIANDLSGVVSTLPVGEIVPDSGDILIIIGKDVVDK